LSIISWIIIVVEYGEKVIDIVDLIIKVLKHCTTKCMMLILGHVKLLKLIEKIPVNFEMVEMPRRGVLNWLVKK